jgi:hypothetical protein
MNVLGVISGSFFLAFDVGEEFSLGSILLLKNLVVCVSSIFTNICLFFIYSKLLKDYLRSNVGIAGLKLSSWTRIDWILIPGLPKFALFSLMASRVYLMIDRLVCRC